MYFLCVVCRDVAAGGGGCGSGFCDQMLTFLLSVTSVRKVLLHCIDILINDSHPLYTIIPFENRYRRYAFIVYDDKMNRHTHAKSCLMQWLLLQNGHIN